MLPEMVPGLGSGVLVVASVNVTVGVKVNVAVSVGVKAEVKVGVTRTGIVLVGCDIEGDTEGVNAGPAGVKAAKVNATWVATKFELVVAGAVEAGKLHALNEKINSKHIIRIKKFFIRHLLLLLNENNSKRVPAGQRINL